MSTISKVVILAGLIQVACSGDDDGSTGDDPDASSASDALPGQADAQPLVCNAAGSGNVNGTIAGQTVAPVMATWYDEVMPDAFALVVSELPGTCQVGGAGSGESLAILFCADVTVGTYNIVDEQSFPDIACPGQMVTYAIVEDETGSDLDETVAGSVTIDGITPCISGAFDLTFDQGDTLTGAFEAAICP